MKAMRQKAAINALRNVGMVDDGVTAKPGDIPSKVATATRTGKPEEPRL